MRAYNLIKPLAKRLSLWVLLCPFLSATATDYYVSPQGLDTATGSQVEPWQTIQHAANTAIADDTVHVLEGIYPEIVITKNNGTEDQTIVFKHANSNERPQLNGFDIRNPWIVIEGFDLTGENCAQHTGAVSIRSGADNVTISNNTIENTPEKVYAVWHQHWGTQPVKTLIKDNRFFNNDNHVISLRGSGHTINKNYFENELGYDAIRVLASDTIISENEFRNVSNTVNSPNHTDIVQAFSVNGEISTNVLFERNLVIDCINTQIGILEDQKGENQVRNWTFKNNMFINIENAFQTFVKNVNFYNNTFYRCGTNTGHPLLYRTLEGRGSADNGRIINNAFIYCGSDPEKTERGWHLIDDSITNTLGNRNLIIGTNNLYKTGLIGADTINEGHDIEDIFINYESNEFLPNPQGPLINNGENLEEVTVDFFGNPRTDGQIDIGAIELDLEALGFLPDPPTDLVSD